MEAGHCCVPWERPIFGIVDAIILYLQSIIGNQSRGMNIFI